MLKDYRQHTSPDLDETRAFLANKGLGFSRTRPEKGEADRAFRATINAVYGKRLYIAYMEYGVDVEIDAPAERTDYGFSIPVDGRMASSAGKDMFACTTSSTVLASPGRPQRMFLAGDAQRLALSIQQDLIRRRLLALTGEEVKGTVEFEPILDLKEGTGRVITANMELIVHEQDSGTDVFADGLREAHFEETVVSTLLLYHQHSHRWMLERPMRAPASRDVKRAIDYLQANLENTVTLESLVAAAGVPGRTLNEHFRAFAGLSPMAYLRHLRFHAVRRLLLSGEVASVTHGAMRYGFLHMGRFAGAYRTRFGESPSMTLERGRHRWGVPPG